MVHIPDEILLRIFHYIAADSPPVETRLREEPVRIFRPSNPVHPPLKSAATVSRTWRRVASPLLWKHVVWKFQLFHKPPVKEQDIPSHIEFLSFLVKNGLSHLVDSLTIIMDPPGEARGLRYADGQFWGILPETSNCVLRSMQDSRRERIRRLPLRLRANHSGASMDELLANDDSPFAKPFPPNHDFNWLWHAIFTQLDLLRITLVGTPDLLGAALSRDLVLSFGHLDTQLHVLSLSRPDRTKKGDLPNHVQSALLHAGTSGTSDVGTNLFTIRGWTNVLLNEGSFLEPGAPTPKGDEHLDAPSPYLLYLVISLNKRKKFDYVGFFVNIQSRFDNMLRGLNTQSFKLSVQFMPDDMNWVFTRDAPHPSTAEIDAYSKWAVETIVEKMRFSYHRDHVSFHNEDISHQVGTALRDMNIVTIPRMQHHGMVSRLYPPFADRV